MARVKALLSGNRGKYNKINKRQYQTDYSVGTVLPFYFNLQRCGYLFLIISRNKHKIDSRTSMLSELKMSNNSFSEELHSSDSASSSKNSAKEMLKALHIDAKVVIDGNVSRLNIFVRVD